MAIVIVNVERVHLALFLEGLRHSERLRYRHKIVGPTMEDENWHVDLIGPVHG